MKFDLINIIILKIIAFLMLSLMIHSCNSGEVPTREPPKTVSGVLNEFVISAPFQYINLDEVELKEVILSEEDIIYHLHREVKEGEPLLGHLSKFTKIDDRFYIYDGVGNSIFKINMDGTVSAPLTKEGSGPGEHGIIWNLKSNSRYIYASDASNARTNLYTTEMDFVGQKSNLFFIDLNNELILTENHFSRGIAPINPHQGLMVILSLEDITDTLTTIMPRIIPSGFQPQLYNSPRAVINHNNITAANYYFLPWLFLFDKDFNHTSTIIVEYSKFEEMDIPPMDFFKNLTNEGFGGTRPITEFKLMDNGDIFFSVRRELFHLNHSLDGTYQLIGKYQFNNPLEEEPLWISDVFQTDRKDKIIIGSWEYIFRVDLPD